MLTSDGRAGSDAPVYLPREDTFLLLPYARRGVRGWLVEVGCGAGWAALEAARSGWRVVGTDVNPAALRLLQRRAWDEGLNIGVVRADLGRGLRGFQRVLANPPYLPTIASQRDPDPWVNLALDGGPDGTAVTRRLIERLSLMLLDGGQAYVVISSLQRSDRLDGIARGWVRQGGRVRTVARRRIGGETLRVWEFARGSSGRRPARQARRSASRRTASRKR